MLWDLTHPLFNFSIAFITLRFWKKINHWKNSWQHTHTCAHAHTHTHTHSHSHMGAHVLLPLASIRLRTALSDPIFTYSFDFFCSSWTFLLEFWNILKTLCENVTHPDDQGFGAPMRELHGPGAAGEGSGGPFLSSIIRVLKIERGSCSWLPHFPTETEIEPQVNTICKCSGSWELALCF